MNITAHFNNYFKTIATPQMIEVSFPWASIFNAIFLCILDDSNRVLEEDVAAVAPVMPIL